ncbi:hypothetical protein MK373_08580, partial [Streptococcus oralis]
AKS